MKKTLTGIVVTSGMEKSCKVKVERKLMHSVYKKTIVRSKSFLVHDEKNEAGVGDVVQITEIRPVSKLKRWNLVKILEKARSLT